MKIKVVMDGKSVSLDIPDANDVEIDLRGQAAPGAGAGTAPNVGPAAKRLMDWIVDKSGGEQVLSIDPTYVESELGLVPVALGRALGKLQRSGMVDIIHRKREDRGRVVAYKLRVSESSPASSGGGAGIVTEDIRHSCGDSAARLFAALCLLAGVDGIVSATFQEICERMGDGYSVFPASKLEALDRGGWITLSEADGIVVCTIIGWKHVEPELGALSSMIEAPGHKMETPIPSDPDWSDD